MPGSVTPLLPGMRLMYFEFYGFKEKPFNLTPDPRFLFLSKNHKEAFAHLLYGINKRVGFMTLTGEVGTGKTTVLRALLDQLDREHYRTALIFNPCVSPTQLLKNICREFGIPPEEFEKENLLDVLNRFLLEQNMEGRTAILVIDEAQNLDGSVLEQVRLISNLETESCKLIQIILAGQPELLQTLGKSQLRQLNQRITVRYHLKPLDFQDTVEYIEHRLDKARGRVIFSTGAMKKIYKYSGGFPRVINAVCERVLLAGYMEDALEIKPRIAAKGISNFQNELSPGAPAYGIVRACVLLLAMAATMYAVTMYAVYPEMTAGSPGTAASAPAPRPALQPNLQPALQKNARLQERELTDEAGRMTAPENARGAFAAVARLWGIQPLREGEDLEAPGALKRAVQTQGLRLYEFSGNATLLTRLGYPALLELYMPEKQEKRLAALVGLDDEALIVDPGSGKELTVPADTLNRYWTGRGYILWKNFWNLPAGMRGGEKGPQVKRLQRLLREAGVYTGPVTGTLDSGTYSAIKAFQMENGIGQDGVVGSQSLMLLYRSVDSFIVPKLARAKQ